MVLGICLSGVEDQFERALLERSKPNQPFVYLEIGTANSETWLSVCRLLDSSVETSESQWRTIGIDPDTYAYEAYLKKIAPEFSMNQALMLVQTREEAFKTETKRIGDRLDFVFIDGCHSTACATGDFLAVELLIMPGGIVVFHDIDDAPGEIQTHCNAPRGVREALENLGLWSNERRGWFRLPDWQADKSKNAFSCAVFLKL